MTLPTRDEYNSYVERLSKDMKRLQELLELPVKDHAANIKRELSFEEYQHGLRYETKRNRQM